jgi:hypothetical protein
VSTIVCDADIFQCRCGCSEIESHAQKYDGNNWCTKADRDANPELAKRVGLVHCMPALYVSDPTWFSCPSCKIDIDPLQARAATSKQLIRWHGTDNLMEIPWREEIGVGIINQRAIQVLSRK